MARLPTVGGDSGTCGTVLNDYLTKNVAAHYTLASGTSVGATSITLDKNAAGIFAGGSYIAVGATTTKCEVRRVTVVSGATLTLDFDLKYAHSAGEFAWVLASTWIPPEWFGCKGMDATFDNSAGLMQAFIDHAGGARFGLTGHFARYYASTPLCIYDNMRLDQVGFAVKGPLSINPLLGLRNGLPDQFFVTLAGQFGSVTGVNTSTNELTLSTTMGTTVGDRIVFYARQGDTLPAPLEAGRAYYYLSSSGLNVKISSDTPGGSELDLTSTGSGTPVFFSGGAARMRWDDVGCEGGETQGLNGLFAYLQQPSVSRNLRCEAFPGPKGCAVLSGQQGDFYTPMFLDGYIGLNLQQAQFLYFFGGSYEDCDILVQVDEFDAQGGSNGSRNNCFFGGHWETAGAHTSRIQTLMGNGSVSAGTFTLSFGGQTTGTIAYNASAATIQTELEALSTIDPGDVAVTNEGGALPSGRMRMTFGGQYVWKTLTGTSLMTVNSSGLTGGTYSMTYMSPFGRVNSIKNGCTGFFVSGAVDAASGGGLPDGTTTDFLTLEATANAQSGYSLECITSIGQSGNAVKDYPRSITVPWDDTVAGAMLSSFIAGGYHGGTEGIHWYLAGRLGGNLAWAEYDEELRFQGTSKLRFGDTGPIVLDGTGTPESVVAAPVGSLYLRTDGGASTTLYVKESGTGATGWIGK